MLFTNWSQSTPIILLDLLKLPSSLCVLTVSISCSFSLSLSFTPTHLFYSPTESLSLYFYLEHIHTFTLLRGCINTWVWNLFYTLKGNQLLSVTGMSISAAQSCLSVVQSCVCVSYMSVMYEGKNLKKTLQFHCLSSRILRISWGKKLTCKYCQPKECRAMPASLWGRV